MSGITEPEAWIALVTLTVLGADNIVFLPVLTSKLPEHEWSSST
jgi:predicted tellurium resistance membrane protein TerC